MKSEVLICGGGPVALVAGLAIAHQGVRVTVAGMPPLGVMPSGNSNKLAPPQSAPPTKNKEATTPQGDAPAKGDSVITTTALAYSSVRLLESIGITQLTAPPMDAQSIDAVRVIDGNHNASFNKQEIGDSFGLIVENRRFWNLLYQKAQHHRLIECAIHPRQKVENLWLAEDKVRVQFATTTRTANTVLAADGRNSLIRQLANFPLIAKQYHQQAIQAVVAHQYPHNATALECFLPEGPLALLPMASSLRGDIEGITGGEIEGDIGGITGGDIGGREMPHISALVWTRSLNPDGTGNDITRRRGNSTEGEQIGIPSGKTGKPTTTPEPLDIPALERQLAPLIHPLVGECRLITRPVARPLSLRHVALPIKGNLALIGDAACAIHPIAGQGFNLALRGVETLAQGIGEASQLGLAPAYGLACYARSHSAQMVQMAAATHWLNRLFGFSFAPFTKARGLGLELVGKVGFIKRAFIKKAMGKPFGLRDKIKCGFGSRFKDRLNGRFGGRLGGRFKRNLNGRGDGLKNKATNPEGLTSPNMGL